jgi:hypothetical protein
MDKYMASLGGVYLTAIGVLGPPMSIETQDSESESAICVIYDA